MHGQDNTGISWSAAVFRGRASLLAALLALLLVTAGCGGTASEPAKEDGKAKEGEAETTKPATPRKRH